MDQYFTTRQGAIRRLLAIRQEVAAMPYSPIIVVGLTCNSECASTQSFFSMPISSKGRDWPTAGARSRLERAHGYANATGVRWPVWAASSTANATASERNPSSPLAAGVPRPSTASLNAARERSYRFSCWTAIGCSPVESPTSPQPSLCPMSNSNGA